MTIHRFPQKLRDERGYVTLNPEWVQARIGKICSSDVDRMIDRDGSIRLPRSKEDREAGRFSDGVYTAIAQIAAERITGMAEHSSFSNDAMEYGSQNEANALLALRALTDIDFVPIGGVENGPYWASLDGAEIVDGRVRTVAEIKIVLPKKHVSWTMNNDLLIAEHGTQVRAELAISGADRAILFAYSPEMKSIPIWMEPDAIVKRMLDSLGRIEALVEEAVSKSRR